MNKNIVWWVGVKNKDFSSKYGGFDYSDIDYLKYNSQGEHRIL